MVRSLTIPGPLIEFQAEKALTPGMHAILLRLGDAIDRARLPQNVADAVWFTLPAAELRGRRDDNHRLRQWLRALMGVRIGGVYRGVVWDAVLIAESQICDGGARVRVLVPPSAINVLRAPETFAKVEEHCLFRLSGAARELYLALADKKRLGQPQWTFGLVELRAILGVGDRRAYRRFDDFRRRVLAPAVDRINDLGTVDVTASPIREGRSIAAVRFEWRWKSLDEAREAAEESDRPRIARRKPVDGPRDAPPLVVLDERPVSREEREAVLARSGAADFGKRP